MSHCGYGEILVSKRIKQQQLCIWHSIVTTCVVWRLRNININALGIHHAIGTDRTWKVLGRFRNDLMARKWVGTYIILKHAHSHKGIPHNAWRHQFMLYH